MSPTDNAIAGPGVPCFLLVRSNTARQQSLPCAMRSSTRAAAVVQASTQATMLMSAPKSMATPSGATPALAGEQVQRAGGFAELARFAAEPQHLGVRTQHEENAGEDGALQHGARNGVQRIARFAAQRGCALETHKAEHGEHQAPGPERRTKRPSAGTDPYRDAIRSGPASPPARARSGSPSRPQSRASTRLRALHRDRRRTRPQGRPAPASAVPAASNEGTAARAGWCSRALRRPPKRRWRGRPAATPMLR